MGLQLQGEVGDLSLKTQARSLRAIQEKKVPRVGGTADIVVDTRIIAATNKDLLQQIRKNEFREDLYYRLNVVPIRIPPLLERKEDITVLTYHFIQKFNAKYQLQKSIKENVLQLLYDHDWPGNVRELEHTIERLLITSAETSIGMETFMQITTSDGSNFPFASLEEYMQNAERRLLQKLYAAIPSTGNTRSKDHCNNKPTYTAAAGVKFIHIFQLPLFFHTKSSSQNFLKWADLKALKS